LAIGLRWLRICTAVHHWLLPSLKWYFLLISHIDFALCERKNDMRKEDKVPLRTHHIRTPHSLYLYGIIYARWLVTSRRWSESPEELPDSSPFEV
jgi:hypothetical protein